MTKSFYWFCGFLIILVPISFLLMPSGGFEGDLSCWVRWARSIQLNGYENAYSNPEIVYHPFYLAILYLYGLIFTTETELSQHLVILKAMVFVFDLAGVFILGWFLNKNKISHWKALFVLLCPGYFYNTICWGQVDSIHSTFCFAAILLAIYQRPYLSVMFYLFALSMKFQAIIFLPILLILLLPQITASKKVFFTTILTTIGICLLIILPFVLANQLSNFLNVFTVAINYFPFVSLHAYNLWYLLFPFKDPMNISDTLLFLGITYKAWGHFLFLIYSIGIILPLISIIKNQFNRFLKVSFNKRELEIILLCCALLPLIFFFFNTQMHERYGHPAIIFAGAYAMLSRKYILFILVSVAIVLNMEGLIYYFQLPQYWYKHSLIFNERFIALIYLTAIIIGFWQLYKTVKSKDMLVD